MTHLCAAGHLLLLALLLRCEAPDSVEGFKQA